jgi:hypothetical protein
MGLTPPNKATTENDLGSKIKIAILSLPAALLMMIPAGFSFFTVAFTPTISRADVICKEETDKFCPGKEWGEGLDDCLKQHHRELSIECRKHVEEIKVKSIEKDPEAHRLSGASCKDDGDQFCRGIHGSKMWKCLKTHYAELTSDCQGLVEKRFRHR